MPIPGIADPRWYGWTRPLHRYLAYARSWPELESWAKLNGVRGEVLRHMLAAMEYRGGATTVGKDRELRWRHNAPRRRR